MENETFAQKMIQHQSIFVMNEWMKWLRSQSLYGIVIMIGNIYFEQYSYHPEFLNEMAMAYFYSKDYENSWKTYQLLLSNRHLNQEQSKNYCFNAHFTVEHIVNNYIHSITIEKPLPKLNLITLSITTCKRFDLFEKTMNSFLHCCKDLHLINRWLCVDDNSSDQDRLKMKST